MADLVDAFGTLIEAQWFNFVGRLGTLELPVSGAQRIARQEMLQVGQEQLLVLLLVMEAELDQRRDVRMSAACQQVRHAFIDMIAIGANLLERRARQQATVRPPVPIADRLVVGIKEIAEPGIEVPIPRHVRAEHELLEEPGRVREVPLRGARVRHALHHAIFRRQRRDQRGHERPSLAEVLSQRSLGRAGLSGEGAWWHVLPGGRA